MSIVSLTGIEVLNNQQILILMNFKLLLNVWNHKEDLEWKLTYVGSSDSLDHDQELDSILVGPVPVWDKFILFKADAQVQN